MHKKPNFLFFITDQQRADWMGCAGHPIVRTPNMDAIAAEGTLFDQFHVVSPVCMPNRASLMTGRYPSVHGLRYNGCILPQSAVTFVDVLAANGYNTAAFGKSHLQPFTDTPPLFQWPKTEGPYPEALHRPPGDYTQEEPGHYKAEDRYEFKTPFYGFQHVDMVTAHGDKCGGHYGQWFRQTVSDWQALHDPANELPHNYSCPQAYRTPVPVEAYPTAYIADQTKAYLSDQANSENPFFTFVSFPDPHHPFNPPGEYWDMYDPADFDVSLPFEAHQNPTPPMQWLYENWKTGGGQLSPQTAMMLENRQLQEAMALTAGMITCVDDAIGGIIECLKETGHYENTVICFNADHGDYLGDFNMLLKGALPFKGITRAPFIWSDPDRREAAKSSALAATIDIPVSIMERAGIDPYFGIQGKSFLDNLDGSDALRDDLLIEYNDGGNRLGFELPARVRSLVTHSHRLTIYKDQDWGELYDLENDPNESHNHWDDPAYAQIKSDLMFRLSQQLTSLMDESPMADRVA